MSLADFSLNGKKAIVCASSRGLGKACAAALAREGVHVVINGRSADTLDRAAFDISNGAKGSVMPVVADLNTQAGRDKLVSACPDADILVNNNDGPPPGNFAQWGEAEWRAALDANMLTPIALIKALVPGMMERGWGRVVNITSQSVKAPIAVLGLSNSARAGLTGRRARLRCASLVWFGFGKRT